MKTLYTILSWLITLITPFILTGLGIRVLLTPLFPNIEYRLPYFPPDIYGFSTQDRLHWGMDGINYLLNNADISYLGDLKLSDGTPLFTDDRAPIEWIVDDMVVRFTLSGGLTGLQQ
jgi:hypothetical protein